MRRTASSETTRETPAQTTISQATAQKPPQDQAGRFTSELTPEAVAHRQLQAYQMRLAGAAYSAIGRALGVDRATAARDVRAVHAGMLAEAAESIEEQRQISAARLDIGLFALMPAVKRGDLKAVRTLILLEKRRSELFGLDAPKKFEHTGENGAPIEMNNNVSIREQWTPQEASSRAQELLRRMEVINRENERIGADRIRQAKAERN